MLSAVWEHSEATGNERLLLLAIADHLNDQLGYAYPSVETLARKTRMSSRWVRKLLGRLVASGELRIVERRGPHKTNWYLINLPGTIRAEVIHMSPASAPEMRNEVNARVAAPEGSVLSPLSVCSAKPGKQENQKDATSFPRVSASRPSPRGLAGTAEVGSQPQAAQANDYGQHPLPASVDFRPSPERKREMELARSNIAAHRAPVQAQAQVSTLNASAP